ACGNTKDTAGAVKTNRSSGYGNTKCTALETNSSGSNRNPEGKCNSANSRPDIADPRDDTHPWEFICDGQQRRCLRKTCPSRNNQTIRDRQISSYGSRMEPMRCSEGVLLRCHW